MIATFTQPRAHASRLVLIALAAVSLALPIAAARPTSASASTDAYCKECYLNEYGSLDIDPRQHNLTLSYAHDLTAPNEWICAGDWSTAHYTCNPNEAYRSYSGQYYFGAEVSHYHGGMYTNAHTDY
jgi:hypothetical protein